MDRRSFLSLGRRGRRRVLELSCERLYVRWADAVGRAARTSPAEVDAPDAGEPPTRVSAESTDDLLGELDRRLAEVDVVQVTEDGWLKEHDLRRQVDARLEAFARRGGVVERASRGAARAGFTAAALVFVAAASLLSPAPLRAQSARDEVLRSRVEGALRASSDIPVDSITVQVRDGVATLTGSVLCDECGGNATPSGPGTVQQSLGAVVRAVPGITDVRFVLRYRPPDEPCN